MKDEKIDHINNSITADSGGNDKLLSGQEKPERVKGINASGQFAAQKEQSFLFQA
jgi:hypothetical protein